MSPRLGATHHSQAALSRQGRSSETVCLLGRPSLMDAFRVPAHQEERTDHSAHRCSTSLSRTPGSDLGPTLSPAVGRALGPGFGQIEEGCGQHSQDAGPAQALQGKDRAVPTHWGRGDQAGELPLHPQKPWGRAVPPARLPTCLGLWARQQSTLTALESVRDSMGIWELLPDLRWPRDFPSTH